MKIKAITNIREFVFNISGVGQTRSPSRIAKEYLDKGENLIKLIQVS
ncbi:hypothetical protein [Clostridium sp.]|nr:hypothetical protein [Clostridium sp.]